MYIQITLWETESNERFGSDKEPNHKDSTPVPALETEGPRTPL